MNKPVYLFVLALALSLNQPTWAQRWSHFPSFGDVQRARYDRRAQIYWFGTLSNGLWRFDGQRFTSLRLPDTPYGPVYEITALAIDEKNAVLWIGSRYGLFRYQEKPPDWKYYDWRPNPTRPECFLESLHITALFVDTSGNLWYGFDGAGVGKKDATGWYRYTIQGCTKWDSVQACWVNFPCREPIPDADVGRNFITCITQDAKGNMYFGTRDVGVLVLNTMGKWTPIAAFPSTLNKAIAAIAVDNQGNKWLGTRGGVCLLDSANTFVKCFTTDSGLVDNKVNAIWIEAFQNGDMKWFGTGAGVSLLDSTNRSWKTFTQRSSGLSYDDVQDLVGDSDGNLWFATIRSTSGAAGGEVSKLDLKWSEQTLADGLSSNFTYAVERDGAGRLWVGTDTRGQATRGGVDVLDRGKWRFVELGEGCLVRPRARDFWAEETDMWIATTGCGIFKIAKDFAIVTRIQDNGPPGARLPSNNVLALARHKNILWAGTDNGLAPIVIDGKNFRIDPTILPGLQITALAPDHDGRLWVGTVRGLNVYDGQNWAEVPIPTFAPNTAITAIAFDTKDQLWVGTAAGLARFDNSAGWTSFSTAEGLPDDRIITINVSPEGTVWLGTANGAAAFVNGKWSAYTTLDGLSDNLIYQIAFGPPEVVWLATWGGGVSRYRRTGVRPETYILNAFDVVTAPKVVFRYSGYDSNTPATQLRYQYALNDTMAASWSPVTSADFVELAIPDSGKYIFFVRAIDKDGNLDAEPAQMHFTKVYPQQGAAVTFVDSAGGQVRSTLQLYFPPHALQEGITIRATAASADSLPLPAAANGRFTGIAYDLRASEKVASTLRPFTVKIFYGAAFTVTPKLESFDARRLGIYQFDGRQWSCLGGTVDTQHQCLTTTMTELGTIALFAEAECAALVKNNDNSNFSLAIQPRLLSPHGGGFLEKANISFTLAQTAAVTMKVYNLAGRLVKVLCENQMMQAGRNAVDWEGDDYNRKICPSGMYVICLEAAGKTTTKTVVVWNN